MKAADLKEWEESFEAFHARFGAIYARAESREQARKYVRGMHQTGYGPPHRFGGRRRNIETQRNGNFFLT